MKYMMSIVVLMMIGLGGCNYLDVVPKEDIETVETIFEKREQVDEWLQTCYVILSYSKSGVSRDPAYWGADEIVVGQWGRRYDYESVKISDGLQMSQDPYGNVWHENQYYGALRYINIFLEGIDKVYNMQEDEKIVWKAEIKALKAHYYFELMRHYGPIILVPENIATNADIDIMQQPRSHFDTCVNVAVRLLDEAMEDLPPLNEKDQTRWAYHSLESAAALKAQILLLAASPLFNGNPHYANFKNKNGENLFSANYDPEKWKRAAEAADAAIQIALDNGKSLVSGAMKQTELLSTMSDIEYSVLAQNFQNSEALLMFRPHSTVNDLGSWMYLPYFRSTDPNYNQQSYGYASPTMKLVEMYYTENGLPINADKTWDYPSRYMQSKEANPFYRDVVPLNTDVLSLHLRREPRFYAHIAADRTYWQLGPTVNDNLLVLAYQGEKFGAQSEIFNDITVPQNITGYWLKKYAYSNIAIRGYGSTINREEGFVIFRLAELYLMKAEAWNEYEGPLVDASHVYEPLNEVRRRAGIPDVEDAWTNYSNAPDKIKTKEGMREIIQQEWNIEFAFEGRRFWNLRRWMTAPEELNDPLYGWNVVGEDAASFYNNYEGPIVAWAKQSFVAPRDYLFPLRAEEVLVSGCVQNPGW